MGNTMYAGFHEVEIQPPLGLRIPGYYYVRLAEGTADPLYLRAAAFVCGDEKAVIFKGEEPMGTDGKTGGRFRLCK